MDAREQKIISDVEKYGCHVIHVTEEDCVPPFAYSVGIEKTSQAPELLVIGLKQPLAHAIINEYNRRAREGEHFQPGKVVSGFIEGFDCHLRSVDRSHYDEYFGFDLWFYEGPNFRVLQLIYPTVEGIWPWDAAATEGFRAWQPLLDTPATKNEHSSESGLIECATHGAQAETLVCQHIVESLRTKVAVGFFWSAEQDTPRPDAWCADCEERLGAAGGEWTEALAKQAGLCPLCAVCYDQARKICLDERGKLD